MAVVLVDSLYLLRWARLAGPLASQEFWLAHCVEPPGPSRPDTLRLDINLAGRRLIYKTDRARLTFNSCVFQLQVCIASREVAIVDSVAPLPDQVVAPEPGKRELVGTWRPDARAIH